MKTQFEPCPDHGLTDDTLIERALRLYSYNGGRGEDTSGVQHRVVGGEVVYICDVDGSPVGVFQVFKGKNGNPMLIAVDVESAIDPDDHPSNTPE